MAYSIIMAVVAGILLTLSVILSFLSNRFSSLVAFCALCATGLTFMLDISMWTYIFWGIAAIIVTTLNFMLPPHISSSRLGLSYIATAALAGTLVGLVVSHAGMVLGAVVGAILGGVAYSKTPQGKLLEFPSSKFLNYLCAKGLPVIITMCISGTVISILVLAFTVK